MFQSPGICFVQIDYSKVTVAGFACEHCQLCAHDTGDEKVKRKEILGHCVQALTLGMQGEGSLHLDHHRLLNSRE